VFRNDGFHGDAMALPDALPDPRLDAQFYEGVAARRFVAFLIDAALIAATTVAGTLLFGIVTLGVGFMLALPLTLAVSFLYRYFTISRRSATPGMALCGIELRRRDGRRLGEVDAAVHTATYLGCFYTVGPQILSVVMMLMAPAGRSLADLATGTVMINRPASTAS